PPPRVGREPPCPPPGAGEGLVRIARAAMEAVKAHGAEGYPHEICGFLVGPRGSRTATEAKRARNIVVERARDRYEIDPRDHIGIADLAADANYEMVFAVLPLFITAGLGAPAVAVGLVEGIADGSSAVVKLWSGWYSDRIEWRKRLAVGGYATTILGLGLLVAV